MSNSIQNRSTGKTFLQILFFFLLITQLSFAQWIQTSGPSGVSSFAESGTNMFAGGGAIGIYISTDEGNTWIARNSGLPDTSLSCLAASVNDLFAGTPSGIFRSTDYGLTWVVSDTIMLRYIQDIAVGNPNLFAGTSFGGVFLSTDNGLSWSAVNNGLTETFVTALAINGPNTFAATQNGVFLSTNSGANWISAGLENFGVSQLAICSHNLFAATYGTNGTVYFSTDNGTSWSICDSGLTDPNVLDFKVHDENVFASTAFAGVFLTTNNGEIWTSVNDGLTSAYISSLGASETNLFAGTIASGLWRRPLSEMITVVEVKNNFSTNFSCKQNYPNPFNSSSIIKYSIPKTSQVILKIYNTLSEEIETLINEEKPVGTYEVTWNAENLPSGVYFYHLRAGEYTATRKMILLK